MNLNEFLKLCYLIGDIVKIVLWGGTIFVVEERLVCVVQ